MSLIIYILCVCIVYIDIDIDIDMQLLVPTFAQWFTSCFFAASIVIVNHLGERFGSWASEVDRRNPAPVDRWVLPLILISFIGLLVV